jgi:CcmD family protein
MKGLVQDSWSYVVAAYAVTFVVLAGYSVRLILMKRRLDASTNSSR